MKKIPLVKNDEEESNEISPLDLLLKKEITGKDIEKESYVDPKEEISRQPIAISCGEYRYKDQIYPLPLGSYGDYSCIVGSSKSKKTFIKSAIEACYIGGKANNFFDNLEGHYQIPKFVISVDTEQSKYHSKRVFDRVHEMVGAISPLYRGYSLRKYSPNQRMMFLDWLFDESPFRNKLGIVSIDGFADLINNFNDLDQANELQHKLMKWSETRNCHIIGILHRNFGSDKPVGHIGSSVLKKAETVMYIEKVDSETSLIKCEYSRNLPFDDFQFRINENWLPYKYSGF